MMTFKITNNFKVHKIYISLINNHNKIQLIFLYMI